MRVIRLSLTPNQQRYLVERGVMTDIETRDGGIVRRNWIVLNQTAAEFILDFIPREEPGRTAPQGRTAMSIRRRVKAAMERRGR
jgi:hypothetical protein